MAHGFVTLGTFPDPIQAHAAVNRLKEAGIDAFLLDETVGGLGVLTGQGMGWIKLEVREADLERAEAVLGEPDDPAADGEIPWDDVDAADEAEKPEVRQAVAEQKAAGPPDEVERTDDRGDRLTTAAFRLAIFGILFVPLTLISLALVLIVAFRAGTLSPAAYRRFFLALQINLLFLSMWGMLFCGLSGAFRS